MNESTCSSFVYKTFQRGKLHSHIYANYRHSTQFTAITATMTSFSSDGLSRPHHAVLFPFMSKGHTIPLLHFGRFLLRRNAAVTVFTTPANRPFVADSLSGTAISIVTLPFPENIAPDIPAGTESTDKLPSMSLFHVFANATAAMQPHFEQALETLQLSPRVTFMVTDAFLWWTQQSAARVGVPRLAYYGMSCYSTCLFKEAALSGIPFGSQPDDELVPLTRFPWIRVCKEDFDPSFTNPDPTSLAHEFLVKTLSATVGSYGVLVNSFYELEPSFVDHLNTECSPKSWCVGPFCLAEQAPKSKSYPHPGMKPAWVRWLDQKREEKCSVLYVAFGSQAEISNEQLEEIAIGLEESMVNFLWVVRKGEWGVAEGYAERVKARGMVTREWVDQREILMHESVEGFVSHCGWNSVLESICAGVPILVWPMMAEQHLNARMVEEEIKVGFRVETCNGSVRGFVEREALRKTVRELMGGERGREARRKVKEVAEMAKLAVQEGGSSWFTLDSLLRETCEMKDFSPISP